VEDVKICFGGQGPVFAAFDVWFGLSGIPFDTEETDENGDPIPDFAFLCTELGVRFFLTLAMSDLFKFTVSPAAFIRYGMPISSTEMFGSFYGANASLSFGSNFAMILEAGYFLDQYARPWINFGFGYSFTYEGF
jgi:hypothetical protein